MKRIALVLFTAAALMGCASSDVVGCAECSDYEEQQAKHDAEVAAHERSQKFKEWMAREDTQKYIDWVCSLPTEQKDAERKVIREQYGVVLGC